MNRAWVPHTIDRAEGYDDDAPARYVAAHPDRLLQMRQWNPQHGARVGHSGDEYVRNMIAERIRFAELGHNPRLIAARCRPDIFMGAPSQPIVGNPVACGRHPIYTGEPYTFPGLVDGKAPTAGHARTRFDFYWHDLTNHFEVPCHFSNTESSVCTLFPFAVSHMIDEMLRIVNCTNTEWLVLAGCKAGDHALIEPTPPFTSDDLKAAYVEMMRWLVFCARCEPIRIPLKIVLIAQTGQDYSWIPSTLHPFVWAYHGDEDPYGAIPAAVIDGE